MLQSIRMSSVHRRTAFLFRCLLAKAQSKSIKELLPIIERSFHSPWVARVELNIRFWPGGETTLYRLWRSFRSLPRSDFMHWDAPVTVSIFRKRRGKERQALCMSLYIHSGILYVAQLQGVPGTDLPKELRAWPKIFIEACKRFARHISQNANRKCPLQNFLCKNLGLKWEPLLCATDPNSYTRLTQ